MENKSNIKIKTPQGNGIVDNLWLSELGYLMLRVYMVDENRWISYNLGEFNPDKNMFTDLLKEY